MTKHSKLTECSDTWVQHAIRIIQQMSVSIKVADSSVEDRMQLRESVDIRNEQMRAPLRMSNWIVVRPPNTQGKLGKCY